MKRSVRGGLDRSVGRSVPLVWTMLAAVPADSRRCTLPLLDQFDDDLVLVDHALLPCALQQLVAKATPNKS
jgi:hypothetical protein